MANIISITNNKGGTGKTTTTLHLAAAFAGMGKRVLAIDLDSQCNLTNALGIGEQKNHIGNLLTGNRNFKDTLCIVGETPYQLALLPASETLLNYEYFINSETDGQYLLKDTLSPYLKEYDFVFIDCPPSLGTLSVNALVASNYYLIPMQAENFAYRGLYRILQLIEKVKPYNPTLQRLGILLNRFDRKTKFGQSLLVQLESMHVFDTVIRQDIALMECTAFAQPIFSYAPKSRGAEDYLALAHEIQALVG